MRALRQFARLITCMGGRRVAFWTKTMNAQLLQRITIESDKCGGRPSIRGKRIRVVDVLHLLSAGASFEGILADYPFLERDDILAAIEYAALQTDHVVPQSA